MTAPDLMVSADIIHAHLVAAGCECLELEGGNRPLCWDIAEEIAAALPASPAPLIDRERLALVLRDLPDTSTAWLRVGARWDDVANAIADAYERALSPIPWSKRP